MPNCGWRRAIQGLDMPRYACMDGDDHGNEQPHVWRWRKWLVNARYEDMAFDRLTIEQIAGKRFRKQPSSRGSHKDFTVMGS